MAELGDEMLDSDFSTPGSATQKSATATRACDYCRQRKTGCSRERPQCRNCKNTRRLCTYTDPVLRKENPTVKISAQLNSLGSRLSRIESLLPSLKQSSSWTSPIQPSGHNSNESTSESTPERLSTIERRMDGIDVKLDSIYALLSDVARANRACTAAESAENPTLKSMTQRRMSISETDHAVHESLGDDLQLDPVGDPLVSDDNGNTRYLGRSSTYSLSADAELLVQSALKGLKQTSLDDRNENNVQSVRECSKDSNPKSSQEAVIAEWEANQHGEDREEANPLSGIAMRSLGDMHMDVVATSPRKHAVPAQMAQRVPTRLDKPSPDMIDEAAELVGLGGNKISGDDDFYIPTAQETTTILDRIYTNVASGLPICTNLPPAHVFGRLFESPSGFLLETDYNPSWVTIGYCLAHHFLSYGLTADDPDQRRSELVLKRHMARNAWASFKDLKLFLTPGIEHVQALMLLGITAQETSRPGLCWMLTCQACRLAQAMGLHRRVDPLSHTLSPADIELRRYLFWMLYILDKSFSLSFGRTSCFQDYDCDVEVPSLNEVPSNPDMEPPDIMACFHPEYFVASVKLAKLQSAVYKKLYSARASNNKGHEKNWVKETEKWVWELDSRLRIWKESLSNLESLAYSNSIPKTNRFHENIIIGMESMECVYHALMTMTHRRLFRPAAGDDDGEILTGQNTRRRSRAILFHSARSAINVVRKLAGHKDYTKTKWSLMYQPFAPFFVLFSKIVTNPGSPTNYLDIGLMSEVGKFLEDIRAQVHIGVGEAPTNGERAEEDGINRFLTVVNAFIRVAKSFIKRDKERMVNTVAEKGIGKIATGDAGSDEPRDTGGPSERVMPSNSGPNSNSPFSIPLTKSCTSPCPQTSPQDQQSQQLPTLSQQDQGQYSTPFSSSSSTSTSSFLPPQTPISSYEHSDPGGLLRWNSMMSINQLQDLASMDVDINMNIDAVYQGVPGHPEVFNSAQEATSLVDKSEGLVTNHGTGMSGEVGTFSSVEEQRIQPSELGVDDTYMRMFETAVRQGAMEFDWISNWEV